MYWTKWLVQESDHDIPDELEEKWKKSWEDYEDLSEELKEKDRKWARKAIQIIKECGRSTEETVCPECGQVSGFNIYADCDEESWVRGCRDEKAFCCNCEFREKGENLTEEYTKTLLEVEN